MKTKLISFAIVLLSFAKLSFAQESIIAPHSTYTTMLQGSLLCGDEVKRVTYISDSLDNKWLSRTTISVDTVSKSINLRFYFATPLPYIKLMPVYSVISVLNPYLPTNIPLHINDDNKWGLNEFFYLDSVLVETRFLANVPSLQEINPFQSCYAVTPSCDNIKVVRRQVREICPTYSVNTKYNIQTKTYSTYDIPSSFSESFLVLNVEDSIIDQPFTCLAIGNKVVVDTIFVNSALAINVDLKINEVINQVVICITTPCYPQKKFINYYSEKFQLPICLQTGIETELPTNEMVYPNPATDKLFVKGVSKITLTDVMGYKSICLGEGEFNVQGLKTGLYLLTYEVNGENYFAKIIIE